MILKITNSFFRTTQKIMIQVVFALFPGIITFCYFFGIGTIIQLTISVITAIISEGIILKLRSEKIFLTLSDCSSLITAELLSVSIPPLTPWWVIFISTVFSIIIAKHIYGGLGNNLFNPAMIGYIVILVSFPTQSTLWFPSQNQLPYQISFLDSLFIIFTGHTLGGISLNHLYDSFNNFTQATPLNKLKIDSFNNIYIHSHSFNFLKSSFSNDYRWIYTNISFLFSGLYLITIRIIKYQIPFSFLCTIFILSIFESLFVSSIHFPYILHLFSGATMLCAFFIATDPVTSPITNIGKFIFGFVIGFLVWLIRTFGNYSDGIGFSILLANILVPLIDNFTKPRVFGYEFKNKNCD